MSAPACENPAHGTATHSVHRRLENTYAWLCDACAERYERIRNGSTQMPPAVRFWPDPCPACGENITGATDGHRRGLGTPEFIGAGVRIVVCPNVPRDQPVILAAGTWELA